MGFATPAAWLGLLLLALPLAVHMLVRDRARDLPFPTLRFIDGAQPVAIRRSRPDEVGLLLLRLALLALAVVALARPFVRADAAGAGVTDDGRRPAGAVAAQVVLIDEGVRAEATPDTFERARAAAEGSGAAESRTVGFGGLTHFPLDAALEGAFAWLETRPLPHEVVVISDFRSALPLPSLPPPAGVSVRAVPLEGGSGSAPVEGGPQPSPDRGAPAPMILDGVPRPALESLAVALAAAGGALPAGPLPFRLHFEGEAPDTGAAPSEPSGTDAAAALLALRSDRLLAAAAQAGGGRAAEAGSGAEPASASFADAGLPSRAAIARTGEGHPRITAGMAPGGGVSIDVADAPGSLLSAALLTALGRAVPAAPLVGESAGGGLVPFERWAARGEAGEPPPGSPPTAGDTPPAPQTPPSSTLARSAWLAVLLLLGAEAVVRRRVQVRRG